MKKRRSRFVECFGLCERPGKVDNPDRVFKPPSPSTPDRVFKPPPSLNPIPGIQVPPSTPDGVFMVPLRFWIFQPPLPLDPFWATAPMGRCPVGHRDEFPHVHPLELG